MAEANHDREINLAIARRTVLKAAGASTALGVGSGAVAGQSDNYGDDDDDDTGMDDDSSAATSIDPIFGLAVAEDNPCAGDAENCFEEFEDEVRPSHEVEMRIDISGLIFGLVEADVLTEEQIGQLNEAVADGSLEGDDDLLDFDVEFGEEPPTAGEAIAGAMLDSLGFNYDPVGLHVEPGDIVVFSAETPDHAVAAFHEGHGRQNRVPDSVGPISSAMPPVGGYWLYQFETEGVYDFYCPPHQAFGMVHRVVVSEDEGEIPELETEDTGRPPTEQNGIPGILGGLDLNIPSSAEVLESPALSPDTIVEDGPIPWADVVEEHRTG